MEQLFGTLLPKLEHIGFLGHWIVFLASFSESLPFVGIFFPGTITVVLFGFLASQGFFDLVDLAWFAIAGSTLGDIAAYYTGRGGALYFLTKRPVLAEYTERSRIFLERRGMAAGIVFGKFVAFVRYMVPFVVGWTRYDFRRFLVLSLASSVLWSILYLLLGYFFGAVSQEAVKRLSQISVIAGILAASALLAFLLYKLWVKRGERFILAAKVMRQALLERYMQTASAPRGRALYAIFYFFKKRFTSHRFTGAPLTALLTALIGSFSLFFASSMILQLENVREMDEDTVEFAREAKSGTLTSLFHIISFFGEHTFFLFALFFFSLTLLARKKHAEIIALCATFAASAVTTMFLKILTARERPSLFLSGFFGITYSFPSAHAVQAVAFYGIVCYIAIKSVSKWKIKSMLLFMWLYGVFLIGLSRIYLEAHYLSDVLAGVAVGILWLAFGIALYQWLRRRDAIHARERHDQDPPK